MRTGAARLCYSFSTLGSEVMPVSRKESPLFAAEAIQAQVERITANDSFAKSVNSTKLLCHIVKKDLEGKREELTEILIGIELYSPDYDPAVDSRVRKDAGRL